jgi:hypothetical protein
VEDELYCGCFSDPDIYDAMVAFLGSYFGAVLADSPRAWKSPWLPVAGNDGTLLRDGQSVYSAVAADGTRGLKITLQLPDVGAKSSPDKVIWMGRFGDGDREYNHGLGIPYIALSCVQLSPSLLSDFATVIRNWVVSEMSEAEVLRAAMSRGIADWN